MHHQLVDTDRIDLDLDADQDGLNSYRSMPHESASKLLYLNLLSKKIVNSKPTIRRDGYASVISYMAEMQENGELCDYAIISADKKIMAHKQVFRFLHVSETRLMQNC